MQYSHQQTQNTSYNHHTVKQAHLACAMPCRACFLFLKILSLRRGCYLMPLFLSVLGSWSLTHLLEFLDPPCSFLR